MAGVPGVAWLEAFEKVQALRVCKTVAPLRAVGGSFEILPKLCLVRLQGGSPRAVDLKNAILERLEGGKSGPSATGSMTKRRPPVSRTRAASTMASSWLSIGT